VIERESGIENNDIRAKIDEILGWAHMGIPHLFIASGGDAPDNKRQKTFTKSSTNRWTEIGFDNLVLELKDYADILPLNDILHLAKHFRSPFLK
jgi:hypothetical protein